MEQVRFGLCLILMGFYVISAVGLLLLGAAGVTWATRLTNRSLSNRGLSPSDLRRLPGGTGAVPGWVSGCYLVSAGLIAFSVLMCGWGLFGYLFG